MGKLYNYVINDIKEQDDEKQYCEDVLQHGCISGMVSGLVFYSDTLKFFDVYKEEINEILGETMEETGLKPDELFSNWDKSDPLALDIQNQNTLAWFGYEETLYRIYIELYESEE